MKMHRILKFYADVLLINYLHTPTEIHTHLSRQVIQYFIP